MGQNDDHIKGEDEDLSQTLDAGKPLYELEAARPSRYRRNSCLQNDTTLDLFG